MKRKTLFTNFIISIVVAVVFALLSAFNVMEKFELRFYDEMSRLTKDPPMSDKILLLTIDDEDINQLGEWPWSRDILANSLIRMKELGSEIAIFDIEYISPSRKAVPANADENINSQIAENEKLTADLLYAIPQAIEGGTPVEEIPELSQTFIEEYLKPSYENLYNYVSNNVSFDNDEYFAKACQFFGNTWLTVNNQDLGYSSVSTQDVNYIRNRMMKYAVKDPKNYILNDNDYTFRKTYEGLNKGFTPALQTMITRTNGVGYTNSNVDVDGTRRRNELFYEYDGKYLGQLVFGPLMSILQTKSYTRTKNALILHDALYPGETERRDVKIPLDEHGNMLINFQHESSNEMREDVYGCYYANVYFLNNLDNTEKNIVENLKKLVTEYVSYDDEGYANEYVVEAAGLYNTYMDILDYKQYLLSLCTGYDVQGKPYDGISEDDYSQYFGLRSEFFKNVQSFVDKDYLSSLKPLLEYIDDSDFKNGITDLFNTIEYDIKEYQETFEKNKKIFNKKYVIIGQTAASTTDVGAIPFVKQYYNVCIHANIMNTILTRNFITPYPWYFGFAATLLLSLIMLLLSGKSSTVQNAVGAISRVLLMAAFIVLFIVKRIYIPILSSVILYSITDYFAGIIFRYLQSSKDRRFITQVASSFANKDTVEQLRAHPELFKTEGQKKYITALFSDIQKFSTFSETITRMYPEDGANRLIGLLNEYLGAMSNEILANNGNIDKYEGDAIISMFGAPDPTNLHTPEEWAFASLSSAIKMKKCEVEFNNTHQYLFEPVEITNENGEKVTLKLNPFQTRIGLNSGFANVGLMGSKTESFSKLNYTMIGDTVNLASRLEGVNKPYKSWIMCSDETWTKANSGENKDKIVVRKLDRVRVVGRKTPVQLYNVIGFREELSSEQIESIEIFNSAYEKYIEKDFVTAGKLFLQASNLVNGDDTAMVLANRCKDYIENGLPEGWDGILNMTEK